MVPALDVLDSIVPISDFNRGKASVAFKKVSSGVPVVVMKHNEPSYVILDINDYRDAVETIEDFELYTMAVERMKNFDPDECISWEDFKKQEGITDEYLGSLPEVEFE